MAIDGDRLASLRAAKLRALAGDHLRGEILEQRPMPGGAALLAGDQAWVLLDEAAATGVGRAVAWSDQRGAAGLRLIAADDAGVVARRAGHFAGDVVVFAVHGRALSPVEPAPFGDDPDVPAAAVELAALIVDAGAEVVIEHGVVIGEVDGLEIARVVCAPSDDPGVDGVSARLEVGVGRHDRDAFAMLYGALPPADALARVVDAVRAARRPGGGSHPLNRLAAERRLRRRLIESPSLVGVGHLEPAAPTLVRGSVKDSAAAIAVGLDVAGEPVVVACSVGIDLDAVPAAADARARHAAAARLVLAVAERDAHPVTRRLAAALRSPAAVVVVPGADDAARA